MARDSVAGGVSAVDAFSDLIARYVGKYRLSVRERAVLAFCARGLNRKEVASELGCSCGTIDTYWSRILRKTQTASQAEVLATLLDMALEHRQVVAAEPSGSTYGKTRQDV
jgi:DNA-binding NarL/FixJ family response regulator